MTDFIQIITNGGTKVIINKRNVVSIVCAKNPGELTTIYMNLQLQSNQPLIYAVKEDYEQLISWFLS